MVGIQPRILSRGLHTLICIYLSSSIVNSTDINNKTSMTIHPSSSTSRNTISRTSLWDKATTLGFFFLRSTLMRQELAVDKMQNIFDSSSYELIKSPENSMNDQLTTLGNSLHHKIQLYYQILESTVKQLVPTDHQDNHHNHHSNEKLPMCCNLTPINNVDEVNNDYSCLITRSEKTNEDDLKYIKSLSNQFKSNHKNGIKWQYFINKDFHVEYPSRTFDSSSSNCEFESQLSHKDVYFSTLHPNSKHVFIVIDNYGLNSLDIEYAKSVVTYILSTLTMNDSIGVILGSYYMSVCQGQKVMAMNKGTKKVKDFLLDQLYQAFHQHRRTGVPMQKNNRTIAIQLIEKSIKNTPFIGYEETIRIAYISKGYQLKESNDMKNALHQLSSNFKIAFNIYSLSTSNMISEENLKLKGIGGKFVILNSNQTLSTTIGDYYSSNTHYSYNENRKIFHPKLDSTDYVVSFAQSVLVGNRLDVVGLDVYYNELFEDFVFVRNSKDSPTKFLVMDNNGKIWYHPNYYDILDGISDETLTVLDVVNQDGFSDDIYPRLLDETQGSSMLNNVGYSWKRIQHSQFIVVMITMTNKRSYYRKLGTNKRPLKVNNSTYNYEFHDDLTAHKLCRHFRSSAITDSGSIYLSPKAFLHPFSIYKNGRLSPLSISNYMTYLKDKTDLIANPGLIDGIRDQVSAIVQITQDWKLKSMNSGFNNYIVRRYVGTESGIFYSFPGTKVQRINFDPTRQEWFLRAQKFPGTVILSSPKLDIGGAGFIVTLSHTVYEGKNAALHSSLDPIAAILGMDMTLGYIYKMLTNALADYRCDSTRIRCFIFDDEGYLIVHPYMFNDNSTSDTINPEKQHLTHIEPQITNDMLNHENFVRKKVCLRPSDNVLERFYEFNTSYVDTLRNYAPHPDHCNKYEISVIPGTNSFLGIVNVTCKKSGINFCPCNIHGKRCIYCGTEIEQNECECPCECPANCNSTTKTPICQPTAQKSRVLPIDPKPPIRSLPQCFLTDCEGSKRFQNCFGLLGCDWCYMKRNNEDNNDKWKIISRPFCGRSQQCFGGKIDSLSPYELIDRQNNHDSTPLMKTLDNFRSSPIGPIAGGIMAFFLFLAMSVYCYRQYVASNSTAATLCTSNNRGSNSSLRAFEQSGDDIVKDSGHHNTIALSSIEINPNAIISPYRMNPGYRRPPPGTDSDHGYSTMTPMGDLDSEIVTAASVVGSYVTTATAPSERIRHLRRQSSFESSSSSSNPNNTNNSRIDEERTSTTDLLLASSPPEGQTVVNSNTFIVSATVHMVDSQ